MRKLGFDPVEPGNLANAELIANYKVSLFVMLTLRC